MGLDWDEIDKVRFEIEGKAAPPAESRLAQKKPSRSSRRPARS